MPLGIQGNHKQNISICQRSVKCYFLEKDLPCFFLRKVPFCVTAVVKRRLNACIFESKR